MLLGIGFCAASPIFVLMGLALYVLRRLVMRGVTGVLRRQRGSVIVTRTPKRWDLRGQRTSAGDARRDG